MNSQPSTTNPGVLGGIGSREKTTGSFEWLVVRRWLFLSPLSSLLSPLSFFSNFDF